MGGAYGKAEIPIADALLPDVVLPAAPERVRPERPLGVNVAGYLNAELGVGEVARQLIGALDAHRVPVFPSGCSLRTAGRGTSSPRRRRPSRHSTST